MTVAGDVLGTAQYMAPEQALAETIDGRTDIYALGVILYRILTGKLPFDGNSCFAVAAKQVTEQPLPLSRFKPIQPGLEAVVLDCMAKDPARRPQTVGDLWRRLEPELEAWAGQALLARKGSNAGTNANTRFTIPPVVAGVTKEPAPRKGSGLRTAALAGAIVITVAGAGAVILLGRGSSPASSLGNGTALDVRTKALATVPVPSSTVGLAAPDARPAEIHAAAPDAGAVPTSVVNPIPAPSSAPAKRQHRERQSREGVDPQPL